MLCKICCQNRSEPEVTCSTNGITAQKVNTAAENKRMYASVFTIISFIIEALIIFLSFTDLFGLSVTNDFLGLEDKSFGVFDLLNKPYECTGLDNFSYWCSFVFFAAVIGGIIIACIVYFIRKLFLYSFSCDPDDSKKIRFGFDYSVYSVNLPIALSIVSIYTALCYNSWLPRYTVYPSRALWAIIALTCVQIAVNKKYIKLCTNK